MAVLVCDDDPHVLEFLRCLLQEQGHEVLCAASGEEALTIATCVPVELVILDRVMPGLGGTETLRRLKQDPTTRPIPVLMLATADSIHDISKCLSLGAVDFLTKPVNIDLLDRIVRGCLLRPAGTAGSQASAVDDTASEVQSLRTDLIEIVEKIRPSIPALLRRLEHVAQTRPGEDVFREAGTRVCELQLLLDELNQITQTMGQPASRSPKVRDDA